MQLEPAALITPELNKSEELTGAIKPETQEETQNKLSNVQEKSEDIKETEKEPQAKATVKQYVIKYVGGGVWIDKDGKAWARDRKNMIGSKNFTEEEYTLRDDIKFMVKYGEMEETVVEF